MSKRLLIAVLILGLCLAFTGMVQSFPGFERGENALDRVDNKVNRDAAALSDQLIAPANFRSDRTSIPVDPDFPEGTGEKHLCDFLAYVDFSGSWAGWYWLGNDRDMLATVFPVLEPEHHTVEVRGAAIRVYDYVDVSGTLAITVYVWENDGGVPGALLYSQTYTAASLPGVGNLYFEFTEAGSPVIITQNSYIVGYNVSAGAIVDDDVFDELDDYFTFGTNKNADGSDYGRGIAYWTAGDAWMSLADYFGEPFNNRIEVFVCHIYSECYWDAYGMEYFVQIPQEGHIDGTWDAWGQAFSAANDTLMTVEVAFYLDYRQDGSGDYVYYANTTQLNGCLVQVWGDDGGLINYADPPLFEYTIPAGIDNMFPVTGELRSNEMGSFEYHDIDVSAANIIIRGGYHITATIVGPGGAPAAEADGQVSILVVDYGAGGSVAYNGAGDWESTVTNDSWIDYWWNEAGFYFAAELCPSEYQLCDYQMLYDDPGIEYGYGMDGAMGGGGNSLAFAQKVVTPGADNLVERFRFLIDLLGGTPGVRVLFWDNSGTDYEGNGGAPGNLLAYYDIPDPVFYPGWNDITIPEGIQLLGGDFYVGYEPILPEPPVAGEGIVALVSLAGGAYGNVPINGGPYYLHALAGPAWLSMYGYWAYEENLFFEVEFCAIEIPEATCVPESDPGWATLQGNNARTGGSELAVGDVWCDLQRNWDYVDDISGVISYCSPVTKGDKVVQAFSDHYVVLNIHDGSVEYVWDASFDDGDVISTQIYATPTIATLNFGDETTPDYKDICFIAGGINNSIAAVDLGTGNAIWRRSFLELGNPMLMFGRARHCSFLVMEVNTYMVMFFATEAGKLVPVEAFTGELFNETNYPGFGWPDLNIPAQMTGEAYSSGATDGTNLFYSTSSTDSEGDVYSWLASDGTLNWQLSAAGGLQAVNIYTHEDGYLYPEGFRGGLSFYKNKLFINSWANANGTSDGPTDGIFYIIDASNGLLPNGAVASNRSNYASPIIDAAKVYVPSFTQWTGGTVGGGLLAFNIATSILQWDYAGPSDAVYYTNGFRSCEPDGVEDLLFVHNSDGFFECVNSVTGEMVFTRRVDHEEGFNAGMGSAIAMAPNEVEGEPDVLHILTSDNSGGVYDMTRGGVDVPRMQFYTYQPIEPVDFGENATFPVSFGELFTNLGCADLIISGINVSDVPYGSNLPAFKTSSVRKDLLDNSIAIAERLTNNDFVKGNYQLNAVSANETVLSDREISKSREVSPISTGWPAWLVSIDEPYVGQVVAPGGVALLDITTNQPLISRGPQTVYVQLETNDADFFLNTEFTGLLPEFSVTVIGGCLVDWVEMVFGVTDQNEQMVTNTGRIADGDWEGTLGEHGIAMGTLTTQYYQGSYK